MVLEDYGWDSWFDEQYKSLNMNLKAGRVLDNSDVYKVVCEDGVIEAGISHRLFYATSSDSELPVPGDWVLIISDESDSGYSIYDLLPRRSFLAVTDEENPEEQIPAAANVDYLVAAVPSGDGFDSSIIENISDISRGWGAEPIFLCYGSSDGIDEKESFKKAAGDAGLIFIDSIDKTGLSKLGDMLAPRKTYAVTGVYDDDIYAVISCLVDREVISGGADRGNSSDSGVLHVLPSSAILLGIPVPGDIGFFNGNNDNNNNYNNYEGDDFGDIIDISALCRFNDCRHVNEPGCAILEALESGELDYDHYKKFLKASKKSAGRISPSGQPEVRKLKKSIAEKSIE